MTKSIAIIGTLDTKGVEGEYLRDQIMTLGHSPILIDVSLRNHIPETVRADIPNDKVAMESGVSIDEITAEERGQAMGLMIKGASKVVQRLCESGKIHGVIGYGGSVGLAIASSVMKPLAFGFPKVIVTTIAGAAGKYIEAKDIVIVPSITDLAGGERINRIEAITLANAAGAICGMVNAAPKLPSERPLIVMSQFGVTTPHAQKAKELLESRGYEVVAFHAVGTGGRSLEELVRTGTVAGVLDVTTHEIVDELVGGVYGAGPDRLETAGQRGVPQVILPGALDMVNFFEPETVPEKFKDRRFYHHNPKVTLMRTTVDESAELGKIIARKVNKAKGPTAVVIPGSGWSEYDKKGSVKAFDYHGNKTDQSWYDAEADDTFLNSLCGHVDRSNPNIGIVITDYHINDPKLATMSVSILDDMIRGKWTPSDSYG
jgi:uncharacterized protein (UPF0261 family)